MDTIGQSTAKDIEMLDLLFKMMTGL